MIPKLTTSRLVLRGIKGNDLFGFYEIITNEETMKLLGGTPLTNDLDDNDFVEQMRYEREHGISYFWSIVLNDIKEFIGFIRLMSYKSSYYDTSFSVIGEYRFDNEFLKYFDRENGWEIEYALLKNHRNKGIMKEAVGAVLEFCQSEGISPIYAKVNHMTNTATVKVLKHHNFQYHLPQVTEKNIELLEVEKKDLTMVFKWESEF